MSPATMSKAAAFRLAVGAIVWVALTENDPGGRPFGVAAVIAAVVASLALAPPHTGPPHTGRRRLLPMLTTALVFLWQSLRGGLDVAFRALHPGLPISPGLVHHTLRLPPGPGRFALTAEISLLPGTLAAGFDGDRLTVHALDAAQPVREQVAAAEDRIAAIGWDATHAGARHG